jgi:hypothetical protein
LFISRGVILFFQDYGLLERGKQMINETIKFGKKKVGQRFLITSRPQHPECRSVAEVDRRVHCGLLITIFLLVSVFSLAGQLSTLPAKPAVVEPPCWVFSNGQWRNNEEGNSECVQAIGWYARYILNAFSPVDGDEVVVQVEWSSIPKSGRTGR